MKKLAILISVLLLCLSACRKVPDADGMYTEDINNCQFIIFKANDEFFEADNRFVSVYLNKDTAAYPEMNNGEFALLTADVTCYDGGLAGYMGNKVINKLISYEMISSDEAAQRCGIPEIGEADFSYEHNMLIYHSAENIYCVYFYRGNYLVYLNGDLVGEYEELDKNDDLAAFLDSLT